MARARNIKPSFFKNELLGQAEVSIIATTSEGINADTKSDPVSTDGVTPLDCANDVLQLLTLQKWNKVRILLNVNSDSART